MATNTSVDYQERARHFEVRDLVVPVGQLDTQVGEVVAVYPAIGMVDVAMIGGVFRYPAEDLTLEPAEVTTEDTVETSNPSARRVAMYWADRDRKYKMTKAEQECGTPSCPRCEDSPPLQRAVFRRIEGQSEKLLGCPQCLFLVHDSDIINHPSNMLEEDAVIDKCASWLPDPVEKLSEELYSLSLGGMGVDIEAAKLTEGKWLVRLFVGHRLVRSTDVKDEIEAQDLMVRLGTYLRGAKGGFRWPS